jgi:hypothetical protein
MDQHSRPEAAATRAPPVREHTKVWGMAQKEDGQSKVPNKRSLACFSKTNLE